MNKKMNYLNARQVSEFLGLPLRTVQYLSKLGKITSFKIGGQWRYPRKAIEQYSPKSTIDRQKNLLTAKQVSKYLCISLRTIHRLSQQGKIKSIKIGRQWRYIKEDIENYCTNNNDFSKEPIRRPNDFIERRAHPRINSNFNCSYSINLAPFKEMESSGIIKDLSASGVFLFNQEVKQIDINDPIGLKFTLVTDDSYKIDIKTKARVVRKVENGLGLKFKNIDKELQNRIIEYVG